MKSRISFLFIVAFLPFPYQSVINLFSVYNTLTLANWAQQTTGSCRYTPARPAGGPAPLAEPAWPAASEWRPHLKIFTIRQRLRRRRQRE